MEERSGALMTERTDVRWVLLSLAGAALLTGGILAVALRFLPLTGLSLAATGVALAYVLFRFLYPAALDAVPDSGVHRSAWTLSADALTLDGQTVPLVSIRMVYIWDNRNALGQQSPGYAVNLELSGRKNILLRTPCRGTGTEEAVGAMREFLAALDEYLPYTFSGAEKL